jgi:hypothetical protein
MEAVKVAMPDVGDRARVKREAFHRESSLRVIFRESPKNDGT